MQEFGYPYNPKWILTSNKGESVAELQQKLPRSEQVQSARYPISRCSGPTSGLPTTPPVSENQTLRSELE